jgi:tetratricopeptide (TPR) repeat protein
MLAGQEEQGAKALKYLVSSVSPQELNDAEHAGTLKLVGDLSLQEKEYQQAVDYYYKWMKFTCKEDPDVYTRLANAYYELKQLDKMIEPTDKAIGLYTKPNKNPYVLKLQSYFERKMYPETVKVAEELVRIFPDEKRWWTQLGFFYMLVEDYKKALSTFEIAYNQGYLEKKSEVKALAQLYATNSIPYKSAVVLEKHMKSGLIEKDATTLASLANSWHQAREYKKAAKYYGEAADMKNDADYYRKQGILLLAAEDYKGALNALQKALDGGSDQEGRIHIAMMEAHIYTGNFKQAIFHVREAKKDSGLSRTARAWEPYIKEKAKNRGIKL